jgi:hypothetical protein
MILYFDSYLTDAPLVKSFYSNTEELRKKSLIYKKPSKLDIAKYTLGTYAQCSWNYELVRYEIEGADSGVNKKFEQYVRNLFPNANIINKRSDSIKEFNKSWDIISKIDDNWIFLSSNNDHPWLWYDSEYVSKLINVANKISSDKNFVSIVYSHFSEFYNLGRAQSPFYKSWGFKAKKIYDDADCFAIPRPYGDYSSIQILEKKFFKYLLVDTKTDKKVIRTEDLQEKKTDNHIMIVPKKELCCHFDGYGHTEGTFIHIDPQRVPPLFIPPGYFENQIMLSNSKNESQNPNVIKVGNFKDKYSFEKVRRGKEFDFVCDLKLSLQGLPTAWRNKITFKDFNEKEWDISDLKKESDIRRDVYKIFPYINTKNFRKYALLRITYPLIFMKEIIKKITKKIINSLI